MSDYGVMISNWRIGLRHRWVNLSLASQASLAGGTMLVVALVVCALAMMSIVTENVITQRAATTALFVDGVVSPHLQELATTVLVTPDTAAFLDNVMQRPAFISRFPYLDVWRSDGTIAYSNSHEIIGRRFPLPPGVQQALQGQVIATFTELGAEEHVARHFKDDYSEIYIPVYLDKAGEVIGVAEIHELTAPLEAALLRSAILTCLAVLATAALVSTVLFGIVRHGSNTIELQKADLASRLRQSEALAAKYRKTREIARNASKSITEITDRYLRTLQADLHDGPVQLIALALLNLGSVRNARLKEDRSRRLTDIEEALSEALGEVRDIATGLTLPEIRDLELGALIAKALMHSSAGGPKIVAEISVGEVRASYPINLCVYRFCQEGLSNALHHGVPGTTKIAATVIDGRIQVVISNRVRENPDSSVAHERFALGLEGLEARVTSFGGNFSFEKDAQQATLFMALEIVE